MKTKVKFSHLPRFNAVRDLYIAEVSVSPNEWSSLDFYEESLTVLGEVMEKDGEVRLTYDRFGHPLHAVVDVCDLVQPLHAEVSVGVWHPAEGDHALAVGGEVGVRSWAARPAYG